MSSHGPLNGQPNTLLITGPDFATLSADEVFERVDSLLRNLIAILNVYAPGTPWDLKTGQIHDKLATGQNSANMRMTINVQERDTRVLLSESVGKESRVQCLQRLLREDEEVTHALELLQRPDPWWSDVYNVLEFFEKTLKATVAASREFRDYRQTANHFRHLGHKGKYPLPENPPNLGQARRYTARLLRDWLDQRMAQADVIPAP
jgi:hypothetical protein